MSVTPTGTVIRNLLGGLDLHIERTYRAPVGDVWASLTEPDRLDRWIGRWEGEAGVGRTVSFVMTAEGSAEPEDVLIRDCEPNRRLAVDFDQGGEVWRVAVDLAETPDGTALTFSMALADGHDPADTGPGWEYYMDRLGAALAGAPMAEWDAYYPSQRDHYIAALAAADATSPAD